MHIRQQCNSTPCEPSAPETTENRRRSHKDFRLRQKKTNKRAYSKRIIERHTDKEKRYRNPMTERWETRICTYEGAIRTDSWDWQKICQASKCDISSIGISIVDLVHTYILHYAASKLPMDLYECVTLCPEKNVETEL